MSHLKRITKSSPSERQVVEFMYTGPSTSAAADDEDECMIVEPKPSRKPAAAQAVTAGVLSDASGKRKRTANAALGPESDKRAKVSQPPADVITLD